MSMTGRPKKPTGLKELQGTDRADRSNPNEPKLAIVLPPRPSFLDDDPQAQEIFDIVATTLKNMQVATEADSLAIATTADLLSTYMDIRRELRAHKAKTGGFTVTNETKYGTIIKAHPLLGAQSTAFSNIFKMLGQFGMTPASRPNVHAVLESDEDSLEAFLG